MTQPNQMRKALEPFAAFADPRNKIPPDTILTAGSAMARKQITMADCYAARDALAAAPPSRPETVGREPTEAETNSACMSFRHDFGLLPESNRQQERFVAREWLRAWQKEGFALSPQDGGADRAVVIEAVAKVLKSDKWPIYEATDDMGLDREQYADFVLEVLAALALPRAERSPAGEDK